MNTSNLSVSFNEHIKSIYPNINFTMVYKENQFLDLTVYAENGFLKTKIFPRQTDNHEYLDVRSSHQGAVLDPFQEQWPIELEKIVQIIVNL